MADNGMSYELMQQKLKEKQGIDPPRWQLYRARLQVKESTEGFYSESFKYLKMYMENLRKVNPGTVVKFEHYERQNLDETPKFKRVFLCFEAMRNGFIEGCRPFIRLDGCFLKGWWMCISYNCLRWK